MLKFILILLIGLVFESAGIVFLKKGMTQLGQMEAGDPPGIVGLLKSGATNGRILLGVFFQALFFACLLVLMAKNDVSFLWPITSLTFVFATLAAVLFLHEQVSSVRWLGVILIVAGAALVTYSEKAKSESGETRPVTPSVNAK